MTATHDAVADLARQDMEADLDIAQERALEWHDQARWCDTLGERERCIERARVYEGQAAMIRERLGR